MKTATRQKVKLISVFIIALIVTFLGQTTLEQLEVYFEYRKIERVAKQIQKTGESVGITAIPTSTPAPTPTPEPTPYHNPEESITVLITSTGSRYHSHRCGRGNYFKISLAEAKRQGYTPCGRCY